MESQNITLALRKDLLRKARLLAVERHTSVSGLLAEFLEQIINEESEYNEARTRQMSWLETGFNLGTAGSKPATREELHAR